jgi:hypothetical protein
MVLPIIPIALMAAARFIAKKGVTAAIKKFGKKTVTEAKKHVKDLTTPVRKGVTQSKSGVRGMQNARQLGRQAATMGAVGGFAVGKATSAGDGKELDKLKEDLAKAQLAEKNAKNETDKAKARADKEIINAALAKAMLEDKESSAPETSVRPKTRDKPLRPKTRPKDMMYGGMAKAKPRTGNTDYRMGGMFMKKGKK